MLSSVKTVKTPDLLIAYHEYGPSDGWPVILSHGFPYSPDAYSAVAPLLASQGARVLLPYVRGYGPTTFTSPSIMRSGQQAALASDVLALMDALHIDRAILGGFDWGGLASCTAAALWPGRVAGLVSYAGYDVVDLARQRKPFDASLEKVMWYQHLFQGERGRLCLERDRRALCKLLWDEWSPTWKYDDETFRKAAEAWDNPDWIDVVIHCYRHVFGNAPGDPELQSLEDRLAPQPRISVPTVTLDGKQDPLKPGGSISHADKFAGKHERWERDVGHSFPYEAPDVFAEAVLKVHERAGTP